MIKHILKHGRLVLKQPFWQIGPPKVFFGRADFWTMFFDMQSDSRFGLSWAPPHPRGITCPTVKNMTKKQKQKTKQVSGWCSGLKMFLWYLHQQIYFIKATSPPSLLFSLSLFAPENVAFKCPSNKNHSFLQMASQFPFVVKIDMLIW